MKKIFKQVKSINFKIVSVFLAGMIFGMTLSYFNVSCIINKHQDEYAKPHIVEKYMELGELDEATEDTIYFTE